MFRKEDPEGYEKKLDGVFLKSLIHGERSHMTRVKLNKGAVIPKHDHHHEQTGILIEGRLEFTIDGEIFTVEPWDCWNINSSIPHSAIALEDSDIIEVFTPIREDYLTEK